MGNVQNTANDALKGGVISGFLAKLATNHLLMGVVGLFVLDMILLDPIPFLDEIVLAVIAILIARWQTRKEEAPIDVTPRGEGLGAGRELKNVTPPKI